MSHEKNVNRNVRVGYGTGCPGKKWLTFPCSAPPEGERKLYLAIESTAELAVQKAKVEITRLLKVTMLRIQYPWYSWYLGSNCTVTVPFQLYYKSNHIKLQNSYPTFFCRFRICYEFGKKNFAVFLLKLYRAIFSYLCFIELPRFHSGNLWTYTIYPFNLFAKMFLVSF